MLNLRKIGQSVVMTVCIAASASPVFASYIDNPFLKPSVRNPKQSTLSGIVGANGTVSMDGVCMQDTFKPYNPDGGMELKSVQDKIDLNLVYKGSINGTEIYFDSANKTYSYKDKKEEDKDNK
jgi:hypothetical protein